MRKISKKIEEIITKNIILDKTNKSIKSWKKKLWDNRIYEKKFYLRLKKINFDKYITYRKKPRQNIIIITIDCLRTSNLSSQGNPLETTPFLDSLNVNFQAISASPYTYPSVPSILTGLYPHNHNAFIRGRIKNAHNMHNYQKISKSVLTLPEFLYSMGYKIYFSSTIPFALSPFQSRIITKKYSESKLCQILFHDLKNWILKQKKPFFSYVQLGDLHEPLVPPKNFKNYFGFIKDLPRISRWDFRSRDEQSGEKFEEYRKNRMLLYDNTLRYVDDSIEKFYRFLEEKELLNSTIILVTSDHGEEFWEYAELESKYFYDPRGFHGVGHGHNVFNKIIEVPILISGLGIHKKKLNRVSTVDIVPTIFNLIGIDYKMKLDGINIFTPNDERILLSESIAYGYEKKALIHKDFKFIYSEGDNIQWLFNLEKDPNETNPIQDEELISFFRNKLHKIYTEDEKQKIREIINHSNL